ncbi:phosphonate ABC transporter ATP-binding protein [Halomonas sp. G11]|uniref:phosphonate ABC transporter ATP-binding protein n=1 Tax=Halomonas sp. G11 TaxID=1684425 RepID=UPI0007FCD18B|nr:phosphonate ABC transporter ATP-binding protein [Halomonas sp. G11]OAZ89393.1 phosphonate ABC transporter ATP-binding protein [Halomonas sp. G11]
MKAINVSGLQKYYGATHVLRGIDFSIDKGECVILLGANGCGKSTLMRCLNGLAQHDAGDVHINGQSLKALSKREMRSLRLSIGVVFQQFNLVQNVSVFQNVLNGAMGRQPFGLLQTLAPLASDELRTQAMACLTRVGLEDKADFNCRQLSGGQQQRVAIARTLMQNADIIIADEPVASLDPKAGREIMDLLIDIVQERGLTVLCSLHQLELANHYGDRVLGMKAGRIELDSPRRSTDIDTMKQLYQGDVRVDKLASQTPADSPAPALK